MAYRCDGRGSSCPRPCLIIVDSVIGLNTYCTSCADNFHNHVFTALPFFPPSLPPSSLLPHFLPSFIPSFLLSFRPSFTPSLSLPLSLFLSFLSRLSAALSRSLPVFFPSCRFASMTYIGYDTQPVWQGNACASSCGSSTCGHNA